MERRGRGKVRTRTQVSALKRQRGLEREGWHRGDVWQHSDRALCRDLFSRHHAHLQHGNVRRRLVHAHVALRRRVAVIRNGLPGQHFQVTRRCDGLLQELRCLVQMGVVRQLLDDVGSIVHHWEGVGGDSTDRVVNGPNMDGFRISQLGKHPFQPARIDPLTWLPHVVRIILLTLCQIVHHSPAGCSAALRRPDILRPHIDGLVAPQVLALDFPMAHGQLVRRQGEDPTIPMLLPGEGDSRIFRLSV